MTISNIDLIALAFGAFNLLRLASYFPQIIGTGWTVGSRKRQHATASHR